MKCKSCTKQLPIKRVELGFKHCTECSTESAYGTVDITYHKTGNTVQHIDKDTADKINKMSRRNTYGSSLGQIKSGGHKEFDGKIEIGASTSFVGSKQMFEKVGKEMLFKLDLLGYDKALCYLKRKYESVSINDIQFLKLKKILEEMTLIK